MRVLEKPIGRAGSGEQCLGTLSALSGRDLLSGGGAVNW